MSIYAYLCCRETRRLLWLGKAVRTHVPGSDSVKYFHIGDEQSPANWEREQLNQVVWKFLSDHAGSELRVIFSHELDRLDDEDDWVTIGGDAEGDMSFNDYLRAWEGLRSK